MAATLTEIREAILPPTGDVLLRFLRDAYYGQQGEHSTDAYPAEIALKARALGLIGQGEKRHTLTNQGYIVGNVAKEYCNWVDHGRIMPTPKPPQSMIEGKDVLDLGCSFGRWLWEFQRTAKSVVGLELQPEYVELGSALAECEGIEPPVIYNSGVERLDDFIASDSIDFVFSRLVFNHVNIHITLPKVAKVMRKGGIIWIQVETFRGAFHRIFEGELRFRSRVLGAFALGNSMGCMLTGRQMALPVRGRMHVSHRVAYPTLRWWKQSLKKLGIEEFKLEDDDGGNATFSATKVR
jgi:SAM-dependent methyltransferase